MKIQDLIYRLEEINKSKGARLLITLGVISILISCYLLINNHLEHKVDLLLTLDNSIPYWPWTVVIYVSLYPMYLTAAITLSARQYLQVLLGVVLMTIVSFICFAIITSHYPRPAPEAWAHSIWRPLIDLIVTVDRPGNTCPSLHVSTSLYVGWMLRSTRMGKGWLIWSVLVSLSTLTLKQHFVWDWVGGLLLVVLTVVIQRKIWARLSASVSDQTDTIIPSSDPYGHR